jgi:hypothetical protein
MSDFFGLICGQSRCFVAAGVTLPFCQRCLGLYTAAGLTAVFLLASGLHRRTLPTPPLSVVHGVLLITAMLGGIHVIDPGPRWRFLCGSWSGQIFAIWLWGGANRLSWRSKEAPSPWCSCDQAWGFALLVLVSAIALSIESLLGLGHLFWITLASVGMASTALLVLRALLVVVRWSFRQVASSD